MAQIYIKTLFPLICLLSSVIVTLAQVPSFGRCPDYEPMAEFDRENFMGKWYEAERYFTVTELASRCISVNYERRSDGKVWVNNEITNRFTNVQRIVSGLMVLSEKANEGKFTIKYTSLPVNYDTVMSVLDTDYDSYAVLWSCSSIAGPVGHTQNVWVYTRERNPSGPVLQHAYGVLDKFKISRTFFVKTDQTNCITEPEPEEVVEENEPGYDIEVNDEEVLNEYYNGVPAADTNYYRQNPKVNVTQTSAPPKAPKAPKAPVKKATYAITAPTPVPTVPTVSTPEKPAVELTEKPVAKPTEEPAEKPAAKPGSEIGEQARGAKSINLSGSSLLRSS